MRLTVLPEEAQSVSTFLLFAKVIYMVHGTEKTGDNKMTAIEHITIPYQIIAHYILAKVNATCIFNDSIN